MIQVQYVRSQKSICSQLVFFCLCLLMFSAGCQFAPSQPSLKWPWKKEAPAEVPDRILAVWSDSVLHQPGKPGVRGFGGRLYFYQSDGTDPIDVDGGLAVYVFDADELDPYKQQPLRKFVFTPEQFVEHKSKTDLGSSYSVWLPWDEVGGQARRLSLISRFQGNQGGIVISEPVIKLLPGVPKDIAKNSASGTPGVPKVQVVGHQQHSSEPIVSQDQLTRSRATQTIDLPPGFQKYFTNGQLPRDIQNSATGQGSAPSTSEPVPSSNAPERQPASDLDSGIMPNEELPVGLHPELASHRTGSNLPESTNSVGDGQFIAGDSGKHDPRLTGRMQRIRQARTIKSPR